MISALWVVIRKSAEALSFNNYFRFMNFVLCGEPISEPADFETERFPAKQDRLRQAAAGAIPSLHRCRGLSPSEGRDGSLRGGELRRRPDPPSSSSRAISTMSSVAIGKSVESQQPVGQGTWSP